MPATLEIVSGDLLDQQVDVIVNAWNRNIIPWWLLIPQGVSAAIKRRAGTEPFKELARHGPMPLGSAVLTGAGRLTFTGIIHVAGISMLWRSSEASIRTSTANALRLAAEHGFASVAMPLVGAGTGGGDEPTVQRFIEEEVRLSPYPGRVVIVRYVPGQQPDRVFTRMHDVALGDHGVVARRSKYARYCVVQPVLVPGLNASSSRAHEETRTARHACRPVRAEWTSRASAQSGGPATAPLL